MMPPINEHIIEQETIRLFEQLGYEHLYGPDVAHDGDVPERPDYQSVILPNRLREALTRINPQLPPDAIKDGLSYLTNPNIPDMMACNQQMHQWFTRGVTVSYRKDGEDIGRQMKVFDFANPANNDWLVLNQFTVQGIVQTRRPDIVVFVNGLPLAVIELKNLAAKKATIWRAYNQLQTYKKDIPELFHTNVCLVISDWLSARMGSLSADTDRFMRWRTIDGEKIDPLGEHRDTETLVQGLFDPQTFLNYLRYFCLFEDDGVLVKKIASYHQYHAVETAVRRVVTVSDVNGSKKGGVIWHTQGAGKSLEMAFLAGRLMTDVRLENPTILMITDRRDLDGQLFGVFAKAAHLLGEPPKQADSRDELRDYLKDRPSGGIIFATIQKFGLKKDEETFPTLSERHNIVVIADEAHRSQYGFAATIDTKKGKTKYGLAKYLRDAVPHATFLAFTGTPISQHDRDTRAVFGDYVSIYDIQQAVEDGATVPIYYESRLAKIALNHEKLPDIDEGVEEILDSEILDEREKEKARSQWSALEAIVGSDTRLKEVAQDIITHYEQRSKTQPGKAIIVTMSREICARLYHHLTALRPEWHKENSIKVVMTAAADDTEEVQAHHTNHKQKKDLERKFKDPHNPLKIVIVRDMWLTGFDAPCLTTMYIDKPMQGANLAQAIARVNRVFKDKPGGLVVDYIGIAPQLKEALATYSAAKGKGHPTVDCYQAFQILQKKIKIARDILHPLDWSVYRTKPLLLIPKCVNHILGQKDGKRDYCNAVLQMTKSFALCGTMDEAMAISPEVAFHRAIRASLVKGVTGRESREDFNFELQQLLSDAIVGEEVVDIFKLAGLKSRDISILSDDFLREVSKMPHKNLAIELLQKLLKEEVKTKFRSNVVKQSKFTDLLKKSLIRYANRTIEAAQVLEELIAMAKEFRDDLQREKEHELSSREIVFYDALAQSESAREVMKDEILVEMAREIAKNLQNNDTVDWSIRSAVRARLRTMIRRLLIKYNYPPDQQSDAIDTVLKQAEASVEDMEVA